MATLSELQRLFSVRENSRSFTLESFQSLHTFFRSLFRKNGADLEYAEPPEQLREFLNVLLMAGSLLGIDVSAAVRTKYRNGCPRCREKPCGCWNEARKPAYRRYPGPLPRECSLTETQRMLGEVFPRRQTLEEEVQHLHDEIDELTQAFARKDNAGMQEEIADVFAWLAQVANSLGIPLEGFVE